ncbi:MAG: helix-turn-helix domain-containing protein [Pseudomonadota bacterium]
MLDLETDKGKLIDAAMALAAERPWAHVSLRDIAERAGLPFGNLRGTIASKTQIVSGFIRAVDTEVLKNVPERDLGQSPRDTLFELLMARFDAMAPYKEGLRSIDRDVSFDTTLFQAHLNSQRWMLLAAGLDGDGPRGVLRSSGLASLSGAIFKTWLEDDDPGLAKTMASLDRRLRRAGDTMASIDQACDGMSRIREMVTGGLQNATSGFRNRRSSARATNDEPETPGGSGAFDDPAPSAGT